MFQKTRKSKIKELEKKLISVKKMICLLKKMDSRMDKQEEANLN